MNYLPKYLSRAGARPRRASTRVRALLVILLALASAGTAAALPDGAKNGDDTAPYLIARSPYTLEETVERVKAAATGHNFRVIREQGADFGFVAPGEESARHRIIYFCDFGFLDDALRVDNRIGLFLPCQVSVIDTDDGVLIVAPNPKSLSREFFEDPKLDKYCNRLHEAYDEILTEATL